MYLCQRMLSHMSFLLTFNSIFAYNQRSFRPVLDTFASLILCADDVPSSVIMVDDIVGIPHGVPGVVRCSYFCANQSDCTSFNIRHTLPDRCEGFNFIPRTCSMAPEYNCQHFEVRRSSLVILYGQL